STLLPYTTLFRSGGEGVLEGGAPRFELVQLGEGRERMRADGHAAHAEDVLRKVAHRGAARHRDRTRVGLDLARDDAQESRLAGTVRAGEPDPRAVGDAPGDVGEDDLPAVSFGDAGEVQHESSSMPGVVRRGKRRAQWSRTLAVSELLTGIVAPAISTSRGRGLPRPAAGARAAAAR